MGWILLRGPKNGGGQASEVEGAHAPFPRLLHPCVFSSKHFRGPSIENSVSDKKIENRQCPFYTFESLVFVYFRSMKKHKLFREPFSEHCKLQKGCTRITTASDNVYQLLAHGRWFSPGTPASSTTKTGRHDLAEILLKVALKHQKSKSKSNRLPCLVLIAA